MTIFSTYVLIRDFPLPKNEKMNSRPMGTLLQIFMNIKIRVIITNIKVWRHEHSFYSEWRSFKVESLGGRRRRGTIGSSDQPLVCSRDLTLHNTIHNHSIKPTLTNPLPSNRQHLSYDACLKVRGEIIRTVLCCIVYW